MYEPFSEYGRLAETVAMPEDRSWVAFNLRPEARWHDGRPVTAADVVWTFETLVEKGTPLWRYYYADVATAAATSERRVVRKSVVYGKSVSIRIDQCG